MNKTLLWIIGAVVIVGVGVGSYYWGAWGTSPAEVEMNGSDESVQPIGDIADQTAGQNTSQNTSPIIEDEESPVGESTTPTITPAKSNWKTYYSEKLKIGFSYPPEVEDRPYDGAHFADVLVKESGNKITFVVGGYDDEIIERRDDKLPSETAREAFDRLVVGAWEAEVGMPIVEPWYDPNYPTTLLVLWVGHDSLIGVDNHEIIRNSIKVFG
ncbi:hypothetical protein DRH29_00105 [candidate division Kazan bacterium]|uniref:Uncharacterized protein n=1 Tax=candidate division Kazan bacterium TaxID=2202143 RepID=A0A420ZDQ6_UNCK3|nr:MAG: hypothetical protein DRH29_00105 [candidate division Kazan bacterium]